MNGDGGASRSKRHPGGLVVVMVMQRRVGSGMNDLIHEENPLTAGRHLSQTPLHANEVKLWSGIGQVTGT